jgi:CheY-like chemotaxis protein
MSKEALIRVKNNANADIQILLAEDDAINRKVLLKMLKKMGYSADVAENGIEVLAALERQDYDLILMDIQMPEMDGITATVEIRKLRPLSPKIIAVTARAIEGDRERCLEAGMDEYLTKPVNMDVLRAAIQHQYERL